MILDAMVDAVGTGAVAALMLVLWLIHFRSANAAIVDFGWAGGLVLWPRSTPRAATAARCAARRRRDGRRLGTSPVGICSRRVLGHPEEGRYLELRRKWRTHVRLKFLLFFECRPCSRGPEHAVFDAGDECCGGPASAGMDGAGVWALGDGRPRPTPNWRLQSGPRTRAGPAGLVVALLAAPELFLRVADLGGLRALRSGSPWAWWACCRRR